MQDPNKINSYSLGLVTAMNGQQLEEYERKESSAYTQTSPVVTSLAGHIDRCWQANKSAKQPIERLLLKCLRQRNGEYEPEELAQIIEQGDNNPIFMMIPDIKCRAFEAWMKDIMIPANDVPFRADPTPVPDLPEPIREYAKAKVVTALQQKLQMSGMMPEQISREDMIEAAEQVKKEISRMLEEHAREDADEMTKEINDQLTEGLWYKALEDVIEDIATFPTGFIEGPILRKKKVLEWQPGGPNVVDKVVKEYERVSPFDVYPSAGAKSLQDGNLIVKKRFSPIKLQQMIGVEGFDEQAIRAVLDLYGTSGHVEALSIDSALDPLLDHHATTSDPEAQIDCLKFWGTVKGSMLIEWGMDTEQVTDPDISYNIIAHKIASYVISARLNPHPLGKRQIYSASYVKKNDSIWGRGVCQVLMDVARICNSSARAILRNAGIASGPMGWMISDKMDQTQRPLEMRPWKMWKFTSTDMIGKTGVPMGFFAPSMVVGELLTLYKHFYDQSGEVSGIPAYTYASEKIGGAGQTASGLSMLFNAAGKVMRSVASQIDNGIIKPSVEELWLNIMLFEPEKAKGDIKIVARASDFLMQLEQMQDAAANALQVTGNPIDMQIIGLEGRGEILREYIQRLKMPVEKIVPDRDMIVQNTADAKINEFVQQLAASLGIDPNKLMAMAQQGAAAGGNGQGQPSAPQQGQPQPQQGNGGA